MLEQPLVYAGAGLVAGPELVPERLDDMVGSHPDVRDAAFKHSEDGGKHAPRRGHLAALLVDVRGKGEEVTKQLVCAVEKVNVHVGAG